MTSEEKVFIDICTKLGVQPVEGAALVVHKKLSAYDERGANSFVLQPNETIIYTGKSYAGNGMYRIYIKDDFSKCIVHTRDMAMCCLKSEDTIIP